MPSWVSLRTSYQKRLTPYQRSKQLPKVGRSYGPQHVGEGALPVSRIWRVQDGDQRRGGLEIAQDG